MLKLLELLNRLNERRISYRLEHNRAEAIMVLITIPGQRWEVEFFEDGKIEVERFEDGKIEVERFMGHPTIDGPEQLEFKR